MAEFLTPHEVAHLAGVTPASVRSWADKGLLPVTRTGSGLRLFRQADVTSFLAARAAAAIVSK